MDVRKFPGSEEEEDWLSIDNDLDDSAIDKDYVPSDSDENDEIPPPKSLRKKAKVSDKTKDKPIRCLIEEACDPSTSASVSNSTNTAIGVVSGMENIFLSIPMELTECVPSDVVLQDANTPSSSNAMTQVQIVMNVSANLERLDSNSPDEQGEEFAVGNTAPKRLPVRLEKDKINRDRKAYPIKPPCDDKCRKQCSQVFGQEDRLLIHGQYWALNYDERRNWLWQSILQMPKARTTRNIKDSRRHKTLTYRFRCSTESGGGFRTVCKVFFLSTLGYSPKSDGAFMRCLNSAPSDSLSPSNDKRGKHAPVNKKDKQLIFDHILQYNPAVHHYRREHAPNVLYLPSDISITDMHADYVANVQKISLETYRKCIKEKNISFATLDQEECEDCKKHMQHKKSHREDTLHSCEQCLSYNKHLEDSKEARQACQSDVTCNKESCRPKNQNCVLWCR